MTCNGEVSFTQALVFMARSMSLAPLQRAVVQSAPSDNQCNKKVHFLTKVLLQFQKTKTTYPLQTLTQAQINYKNFD